MRYRPRERSFGPHARPLKQLLPRRGSGLRRRVCQSLLEPRAIIKHQRIPTNRECDLGPSATCIYPDRGPRLIRIRRSAVRLLDLEQLHARLLRALVRAALHVEGFAAAAAALLIRISEGEAAFQFLFDVVHLGPEDEHDRLRIDQDRHPLILDDLVEFALLVSIFERVAEPRAAAGPHADPYTNRRLAALGEQRLDALRRSVRHRQGLLSRQHPICSKREFRTIGSSRDVNSLYGCTPPAPPLLPRQRAGRQQLLVRRSRNRPLPVS